MDWSGYTKTIEAAPNRSVFCLHACAHNPTGIDPTPEQWRTLAEIFKRKDHFVLFEWVWPRGYGESERFRSAAYLGFVSGSVETDRFSIELFFHQYGIRGAVAVGFGKNFGLYGERVGALHMVCKDAEEKAATFHQVLCYNRWENSGPPRFGAEVVSRASCKGPKLNRCRSRSFCTMMP
jgi:aspartate/tyrosine/aromatic aminotransferase